MKPSVFVSYRRDDSRDVVGRICDRLAGALGAENVFLDVDSIPLGVDFRRILREEVGQCHVLLAVVGPGWLDAVDSVGVRRLEDPDDFVRIEIEAALEAETPVIPVLVNGSGLPQADQLPGDLRRMFDLVPITLGGETNFDADLERLLGTVQTLPTPARELTGRERLASSIRQARDWSLTGAFLGLAIGLAVLIARRIRPLPDLMLSVLTILSAVGVFWSGSPAGAAIGWRLARTKGAICGLVLGAIHAFACYLFLILVGYILFGTNSRLDARLSGEPVPLLWICFSASGMAIVGICLGGLTVATRVTSRWRRTWPRRKRALFVRVALGAALGAVLGCVIGVATEIVGFYTPFHEYVGLLYLPLFQLATLGAVGGFLDGQKQRRNQTAA